MPSIACINQTFPNLSKSKCKTQPGVNFSKIPSRYFKTNVSSYNFCRIWRNKNILYRVKIKSCRIFCTLCWSQCHLQNKSSFFSEQKNLGQYFKASLYLFYNIDSTFSFYNKYYRVAFETKPSWCSEDNFQYRNAYHPQDHQNSRQKQTFHS